MSDQWGVRVGESGIIGRPKAWWRDPSGRLVLHDNITTVEVGDGGALTITTPDGTQTEIGGGR
jgi:hypothetical protein